MLTQFMALLQLHLIHTSGEVSCLCGVNALKSSQSIPHVRVMLFYSLATHPQNFASHLYSTKLPSQFQLGCQFSLFGLCE